MSFQAKYGGNCDACGERIRKDDWVKYVEDSLVHADCDAASPTERQAEVCTGCWLTKPCECEDETAANIHGSRVRGGDQGA